jgi:6-pyruvoyl-tetrahydropterin synthase related domain
MQEQEEILGTPATNSSSSTLTAGLAKQPWIVLLTIGLAAFAAEIPFFFFGTPSGHDVEFHLYSWLEVLGQWRHGIFFPRWAALANFAHGEPRFLFYPPASWTLGAVISAIFPWSLASPIYIWIVLVLAGLSMYGLARRWLGQRDALFAAVLYAVNPYHLVIVYWRSAFAELLASCIVPLLLLLVIRVADRKRCATVPLGMVLAAAWLTNAPAAVMIHYSLALLLIFFAWQRKSWQILVVGTAAVALGACLAAFYLVPAIYEQRWIDITQAISPGSRPQDSFLFSRTTDPDHDAFNHIVSWVALLEMMVIGVAAWLAKAWRESRRELWRTLLAWAIAASVLMFPFTLFFWNVLPKMEYMQFPWRWLLCLSMVFSIFVTVGLQRWWQRGAVCVLSILVIVVGWSRFQAPWWDNAADLREMQDNMATGAGYEGVDEYLPLGADSAAIDKDARKVTVDGPAHAAIDVLRWDPESREFTVQMSAPDQVALRLFRYPAWKATVNGKVVETGERPRTGQMLVPMVAGMNRVQVKFVRTWDRSVGGWISLLALGSVLVWMVRIRLRT